MDSRQEFFLSYQEKNEDEHKKMYVRTFTYRPNAKYNVAFEHKPAPVTGIKSLFSKTNPQDGYRFSSAMNFPNDNLRKRFEESLGKNDVASALTALKEIRGRDHEDAPENKVIKHLEGYLAHKKDSTAKAILRPLTQDEMVIRMAAIENQYGLNK